MVRRSRPRSRVSTPRQRASRIEARRRRIDREHHVKESPQCRCEVSIGQLVPDLATFGLGDDDAAVPEAREVIRHVLAGEAQLIRKPGGIGRTIKESQEHP